MTAGDGPPTSTVVVRFRVPGQMAQLDAQGLELRRHDKVIVESEHGPIAATVLMEPEPPTSERALAKVLRVADDNDQRLMERNRLREQEALTFCKERIRALDMPMKLVDVELSHSGSRATFSFTSPDRIDFRQLVKDLAKHLHTRIEMRQVGVRDAARFTGGIGVCGRELCCSTWLPEFRPVSIRMAKDQNLALNHDKLSGQCGRLRCCLRYEQELYQEARQRLPRVGQRVVTPAGEARVRDVHALDGKVGVILDDGSQAVFNTAELARPPEPEQSSRPPKDFER